MKIITINITHDEVFEDFKNTLLSKPPKISEIIFDNDGAVVNITATLAELEND